MLKLVIAAALCASGFTVIGVAQAEPQRVSQAAPNADCMVVSNGKCLVPVNRNGATLDPNG